MPATQSRRPRAPLVRDRPGRPTLAQIRKWPATVGPAQAQDALGISDTTFYRMLAEGRLPVKVIRDGGRCHVITATLIAVLEGRDPG